MAIVTTDAEMGLDKNLDKVAHYLALISCLQTVENAHKGHKLRLHSILTVRFLLCGLDRT